MPETALFLYNPLDNVGDLETKRKGVQVRVIPSGRLGIDSTAPSKWCERKKLNGCREGEVFSAVCFIEHLHVHCKYAKMLNEPLHRFKSFGNFKMNSDLRINPISLF